MWSLCERRTAETEGVMHNLDLTVPSGGRVATPGTLATVWSVEVAGLDHEVAIRDSKEPEGAVLVVRREEWRGFVKRLNSSHARN